MNKEKIFAYVFLPICLLSVGLCTYVLADTVLFQKTEGHITLEGENSASRNILLTTCRRVNPFFDGIVVSDGNENGVIISPGDAVAPTTLGFIIDNKKLIIPRENCTVLHSTLTESSFRPGRRGGGRVESTKGAIEARCTLPHGTISVAAEVHACQ